MQPAYGSHLSDMVAPDQIRRSIRRLFPNTPTVILGEILQNSQRASARHVDFAFTPTGFTCVDDGNGLQDGAHGFHALLQMGRSRFLDEHVEDQDPMGLGIHSLLACDGITEVTFASHGLRLHIVTERWWEEKPYYATWFERLEAETQTTQGFAIELVCTEALRTEIQKLLLNVKDDQQAPARGYQGILAITCDGVAVRTDIPLGCFPRYPVIETTYQGNRLVIGFNRHDRYPTYQSHITWYGQLIGDVFDNTVSYCLQVENGRPVHPQAPVRSHLIQDAALTRLHAFVWDAVFAYLRDPANRDRLHTSWVTAAFAHDNKRACREFSFFVATRCVASPEITSIEELTLVGSEHIFDYVDAPLMIDAQRLLIETPHTPDSFEYGLTTFFPLLDQPCELVAGDETRLQIQVLWWRPGKLREIPYHGHMFFAPGEWGLGTEEMMPEVWHPVTCPVLAFHEGNCLDVDSVDFQIGNCVPANFYGGLAWSGFAPDEDEPYEEQRDAYAESCNHRLRQVIGDCVPVQFTTRDIRDWMVNKLARIETVTYHYSDGATDPTAIDVVNEVGEHRRLRLYR